MIGSLQLIISWLASLYSYSMVIGWEETIGSQS